MRKMNIENVYNVAMKIYVVRVEIKDGRQTIRQSSSGKNYAEVRAEAMDGMVADKIVKEVYKVNNYGKWEVVEKLLKN